ncbi:MAG: GAF domain-containing protein, partial [Actinomycetia bacterium]|nr:GAF domain-containing protein [Actinomycetes bacterium]
NFPDTATTSRVKLVSLLLLFPSVSISLLAVFTPGIVSEIKKFSWGVNVGLGPLYGLFYLFFVGYMLAAFIILFSRLRTSSGMQKLQVQYIFVGVVSSVILGSLTNLILPAITGLSNFSKFGPFSTIIFVGFTAFAIMRYKLMDIRPVVLKSIAFTLFWVPIITSYVLVAVLLAERFQGVMGPMGPIASTVVVLIIVTETRNPLLHFIENLTDRLFAKGMYKPAELRKELENISQAHAKQEDLTRKWLETITTQMKISQAAIIITNSPSINSIEQVNYDEIPKEKWQAISNRIYRDKKMMVIDDLAEDSKSCKILREAKVEVAFPVTFKKHMHAFVALGEKRSGDAYSKQDLTLLKSFSRTAAVALARSEVTQKVETLYNQAQTIISNQDLKEILDLTIESAFLRTHSDGGSIMLFDDKTKTLNIAASRGLPEKYHSNRIKIGEGIAGRVASIRKAVLIPNGDKELGKCMRQDHLVSAMSVPLIVGDNLIGVLNVNRTKSRQSFTAEDKGLVSTLAANIAQKIQNARLIEEDREKDKEVINIFTKAIEARDPYTFGHSEQVTKYSTAIAKKMGMGEDQILKVELAAVLHDIGKIGIPDNILLKRSGLTAAEFQKIKNHPVTSMELIVEYSKLKDVAMIALSHHEKFDGSGYPQGLKGEEIPIESRVLAVADAYSAMTSDRPYRKAMPGDEARVELADNKGGQFDPQVVEAFLGVTDSILEPEVGLSDLVAQRSAKQ